MEERKRNTHTHTHTHTSPFFKASQCFASSNVANITHCNYFITIHPSAILKMEFVSICMCLSFHYNISQGDNAFHQSRSFPSSSFYLSSRRNTWSMALPSLAHALLPVFQSLFYLISLLATAPTHREFFIIRCKLLAETTC